MIPDDERLPTFMTNKETREIWHPTDVDEAAWHAWWATKRQRLETTERDAFLAGRVSGRADAAAQALDDADRAIHAAKPKHLTRDYTPVDAAYDACANICRARAAQYREKGTT